MLFGDGWVFVVVVIVSSLSSLYLLKIIFLILFLLYDDDVSKPLQFSLLYNNPYLLFLNSFSDINDDDCIDGTFDGLSSSFPSYPQIIFLISNIDDIDIQYIHHHFTLFHL